MKRVRFLLACAALAASVSNPASAQSWSAVGTGEGRAARIEQAGPVLGLGFVCHAGRPLLSVRLAAALPGSVVPVRLMVGQRQVAMNVQRNVSARQFIYVAPVADAALLDMIRSAPAGARLVMIVGQRTTAVLNLDNARSAIDSALGACLGRSAGSAAGTVRPGMPRPGFYLLHEGGGDIAGECRKLTWDALFWYGAELDPVLKIDSGEPAPEGYRVINANRLELRQRDHENKWQTHAYLRCDESVLPPDARYFDQPRSVASLPIKPGYYRLRKEGAADYILLDTTRIAWIEDSAFDSRGNVTRRTNRVSAISDIKQQGDRVYTFSYRRWPDLTAGEDMSTDFMLIEAPDRLTGWFQELDTIRYEPVTAAQIPTALRPRF